MRANPGGLIAPSDVVGRDRLIDTIWRSLDQQSVQLISERRIGKTSVARKMTAEPRDGFICFFRDLEQLSTIPEFVDAVYRDSASKLGVKDRFALGFKDLVGRLTGSGFEIGHLKLPDLAVHWKALLTTLIADLCKDEDRRVVFFWDELPLFIHKLHMGRPADAMELLDVLRGLRQTHANFRMVFTGSVGLHLVLAKLQRQGYANAPVNDMRKIDVEPLDHRDSLALAERLIAGENLQCDEIHVAAEAITTSSGRVPFYIHCILFHLAQSAARIDATAIETAVQQIVGAASDPAELRYFLKRIDTYYDVSDAAIAKTILAAMAASDTALPAGRMTGLVSADENQIFDVLDLLAQDHYVVNDESGYHFRSPLMKRWWRRHRVR
jgi:hypothetical protein